MSVYKDLLEELKRMIYLYKDNKEEYDFNSFKLMSNFTMIVDSDHLKNKEIEKLYDCYCDIYPFKDTEKIYKCIKKVLERNILYGNDKTMKKDDNEEIVFSKYIFIDKYVVIKEYILIPIEDGYTYQVIKEYPLEEYLDI